MAVLRPGVATIGEHADRQAVMADGQHASHAGGVKPHCGRGPARGWV